MAGGAFRAGEAVRRACGEAVLAACPGARVTGLHVPMAAGAALLAFQAAGQALTPTVVERLLATAAAVPGTET